MGAFKDHGRNCGAASAEAHRAQVLAARKTALGTLAGKHLEAVRGRLSDTPGVTSEAWALGFFDAFLTRAEIIRAAAAPP